MDQPPPPWDRPMFRGTRPPLPFNDYRPRSPLPPTMLPRPRTPPPMGGNAVYYGDQGYDQGSGYDAWVEETGWEKLEKVEGRDPSPDTKLKGEPPERQMQTARMMSGRGFYCPSPPRPPWGWPRPPWPPWPPGPWPPGDPYSFYHSAPDIYRGRFMPDLSRNRHIFRGYARR